MFSELNLRLIKLLNAVAMTAVFAVCWMICYASKANMQDKMLSSLLVMAIKITIKCI